MDRNSTEAQEARVWLIVEAMRAQDDGDEAMEKLASLLLCPTDAEIEIEEEGDYY